MPRAGGATPARADAFQAHERLVACAARGGLRWDEMTFVAFGSRRARVAKSDDDARAIDAAWARRPRCAHDGAKFRLADVATRVGRRRRGRRARRVRADGLQDVLGDEFSRALGRVRGRARRATTRRRARRRRAGGRARRRGRRRGSRTTPWRWGTACACARATGNFWRCVDRATSARRRARWCFPEDTPSRSDVALRRRRRRDGRVEVHVRVRARRAARGARRGRGARRAPAVSRRDASRRQRAAVRRVLRSNGAVVGGDTARPLPESRARVRERERRRRSRSTSSTARACRATTSARSISSPSRSPPTTRAVALAADDPPWRRGS